MRALLVALASLVAPGFAQALMRERRAAWIAFAAMAIVTVALAFTTWAVFVGIVVFVVTLVDAMLRHRRLGPNIPWSWSDPLIILGAMVVLQIGQCVFVVEAFKSPSTSMSPSLQIGDHFFINKLTRSPGRGDIITFRHPCEPERDYVKRVIALGGDTLEIRCNVLYLNGTAVTRELVEAKDRYEDLDVGWGNREEQWHWRECSRYRETLDGRSFEIFHDSDLPVRDAAWKTGSDPRGDAKDYPQDREPRNCSYQPDGETRRSSNQAPGTIVATTEPTDPCKPFMHYVVPDDHVFVLGDNRANSNDSRYWGSVPLANIKGKVTGRWYPLSRFGAID